MEWVFDGCIFMISLKITFRIETDAIVEEYMDIGDTYLQYPSGKSSMYR